MDRNHVAVHFVAAALASLSARRAWIEIAAIDSALLANGSLSARRAWIEISNRSVEFHLYAVALRKESVDRNGVGSWPRVMNLLSLSARRAWIEIAAVRVAVLSYYRRSPQGERG